MSMRASAALQAAIFDALTQDGALGALVGADIFDAAPAGVVPALYVSLGPEDVRPRGDQSGTGAYHDFSVSVVSDGAGFRAAKEAAGAVCAALEQPLSITGGRVVGLWFQRAQAKRAGNGRRIDLRFRAFVTDDNG